MCLSFRFMFFITTIDPYTYKTHYTYTDGSWRSRSEPETESGGQFHAPTALYSIEYEGGPHSWPGYSSLTLRSLTLYIYGAPILDVSRSHTTTQHSR